MSKSVYMDMESAQDAEAIAKLKKEKHDLKFEIRQLRERVDKLEEQDIAHRKCLDTMNATITMQFMLMNSLTDLVKGLAEDVERLTNIITEEDK